ncbi:MAG: hypothetical protein AAGC55_01705 [Myxococcota bacterium]
MGTALRAAAMMGLVAVACKSDPVQGQAPAMAEQRAPEAMAEAANAADREPAPDPSAEPAMRRFATAAEAIAAVLAERPRIIGFGEFHQTIDSAPVRASMDRFYEAFEVLDGAASALIVETWIEDSRCGATEARVGQAVRTETRRPEVVESQLERLLRRAATSGVRPHVLTFTCDEYRSVVGLNSGEAGAADRAEDTGEGGVAGGFDHHRMLTLIKSKLAALAIRAWRGQEQRAAAQRKTVVIYGGAVHNDVRPYDSLVDYSYAADLIDLVGEGYVEVDLFVPEYIVGNGLLSQESWYSAFIRHAGPDRVLLFERWPRSYVLIFRTEQRVLPR